jgi:hypothetical protein
MPISTCSDSLSTIGMTSKAFGYFQLRGRAAMKWKDPASRMHPCGRQASHHTALADLNMLLLLPGRERTAMQLLKAAGDRLDRITATASSFQVIEACRIRSLGAGHERRVKHVGQPQLPDGVARATLGWGYTPCTPRTRARWRASAMVQAGPITWYPSPATWSAISRAMRLSPSTTRTRPADALRPNGAD